MPAKHTFFTSNNRAILTWRLAGGLFDGRHASKPSRIAGPGLALLSVTFAVLLAMCGCGSGVNAPSFASLSLNPGALQFGAVPVGGEANSTVNLSNHGSAAVVISSVNVAGQTFSVADAGGLPISIPGGGTHAFKVGFAPASAVDYSGVLRMMDASARTVAQVAMSGRGWDGGGPQLAVSASSLSFGNVAVGTSVSQTVTLSSTGSSPVTVNSASVSAAGFYAAAELPVTLNPGQSMNLVVRFQPWTAGADNAQLSISSNSSSGGTNVIALSGTGTAAANPQLGVSTSSLSFGNVTVGTSAPLALTLSSTGSSPVTVNSAAIAGTGFTLAGQFPATLNPGQSMTVVVQFQPTKAADATGQLSISSNSSSGATTVIALSGTGTSAPNPQLGVSTSSLSFGNVTVGTSAPLALTLSSTGSSPVTVNSAAISGTGFTLAGQFPATLNPGQSMTVVVQFQPTKAASATGQLSISSNSSSGATTVIALSGTGTSAPNPQLGVSTSSLSFGDVSVGTSAPLALTLSSTGSSPVTVNSAAISGTGFTLAGQFPATLNPGQSMTLVVQFQPTKAASATGQLSISSNSSSGATTVIALSGTGTAAANPQLGVSTSSLSFGNVTVGTSAPLTLTLSSTGSSPVTVNSAAIAGTGFTLAGQFPATLNPGQSMTVVVQFQPTKAADATGQLSISSNSSSGATTVIALSGTGTAADPQLVASATSLSFGSTEVNVATTQGLAIKSTGTTPVTISSAQIQGAGFIIVGGNFPVTLNPGQTLTISIQFQPATVGSANAQLTITSNSLNGGTLPIPLSGTATAASHEVDLSWTAPANSPDPVAGYNIYRSVSGAAFVRINSVAATTAYVDNTVTSSVSYGYVVKSVDAAGVESVASNEYQVTIP